MVRRGLPSGSPSCGPWRRFHHPSCVAEARLSAAWAGVAEALNRNNTARARTSRRAREGIADMPG